MPKTSEISLISLVYINTSRICILFYRLDLELLIIMQVDQAGCHRAKRLRLPSNIILIFQPAHSPQLNPIERVWLHLKQGLRFALPKIWMSCGFW